MLFPVSVIMTCIVFLFYLNTANVGFAIRNRNTLQPAEDSLICNQHTNEVCCSQVAVRRNAATLHQSLIVLLNCLHCCFTNLTGHISTMFKPLNVTNMWLPITQLYCSITDFKIGILMLLMEV